MLFQLLGALALPLAKRYPYLNAFLFLLDYIIRKRDRKGLPDTVDPFRYMDENLKSLPDGERVRYTVLYAALYHGLKSVEFLKTHVQAKEKEWHGVLAQSMIGVVRRQLAELFQSDDPDIKSQRHRYIELLAMLYIYRDKLGYGPMPYRRSILATLSALHELVDDFEEGYRRGLDHQLEKILRVAVNMPDEKAAEAAQGGLIELNELYREMQLSLSFTNVPLATELHTAMQADVVGSDGNQIHLAVQQKLEDASFQTLSRSVILQA